MSAQFSLPLRLRDHSSLDNFHVPVSSGIQALLPLLMSEQWSSIFLAGVSGSGKSHLAQGLCRYWQMQYPQRQLSYLPLGELWVHGPALVKGLDSMDLVVLDDVHCISGDRDWEEAVFHLYNRLQARGGHMLFCADRAPADLELEIRDLASRFSAASIWRIEPLGGEALREALTARANRLGFELSSSVLDYLFTRWKRDAGSLFALLEQLDSYSFNQQRRLTLPLVRSYMEQFSREDQVHG